MSATCPNGHVSATEDYCDQCGAPITPSPLVAPPAGSTDPAPAPPDAAADNDEVETSTSARQEPCPQCAPQGLEFPPDYLERRYPLTDYEVKIGRTHEPAEAPDINLSGAPEDPAISH